MSTLATTVLWTTLSVLGLLITLMLSAWAILTRPRGITFDACVIGDASFGDGKTRSFPLGFPPKRNLRKGDTFTVEARPQVTFLAKRLVIPSDVAGAFRVDDLRIGRASAFGFSIDARSFTEKEPPFHLKAPEIEAGTPVMLRITCVGDSRSHRLAAWISRHVASFEVVT